MRKIGRGGGDRTHDLGLKRISLRSAFLFALNGLDGCGASSLVYLPLVRGLEGRLSGSVRIGRADGIISTAIRD
jgi:hypothetical protein